MAWPPARPASAARLSARWMVRILVPPSTTSPIITSSPTTAMTKNRVTEPSSPRPPWVRVVRAFGDGVVIVFGICPGGWSCVAVSVRAPGIPGRRVRRAGRCRSRCLDLRGVPTGDGEPGGVDADVYPGATQVPVGQACRGGVDPRGAGVGGRAGDRCFPGSGGGGLLDCAVGDGDPAGGDGQPEQDQDARGEDRQLEGDAPLIAAERSRRVARSRVGSQW